MDDVRRSTATAKTGHRIYARMVVLIGLLVASSSLPAQNIVNVDQRVDEMVDAMPAYGPRQLQWAIEDLLELGPAGVSHLLRKLGDVQEDDNQARLLISGLAKHLGANPERPISLDIEERFNQYLLAEKPPRPAQAYVMSQLQFFATDASVEPLSTLITELCFPVVRVLTTVGTPHALEAMMSLADQVPSDCNAAILKACQSISGNCHPLARTYLEHPDGQVRASARQVLITEAPEDAYDVLMALADKDPAAIDDVITLLDQQANQGNASSLKSGVNDLLKIVESGPTTVAICELACRHMGEKAVPILNKALRKASERRAAELVGLLAQHNSIPLSGFLKKAEELPVMAQVALVSAAADRGDKSALPLARRVLSYAEAGPQAYAIRALSALQGESALSELLAVLKQAKYQSTADAAAKEVSQYISDKNQQILKEALHSAKDPGKVALLNLLAGRGMTDFFGEVANLLVSDDGEVGTAAGKALPYLANGVDLDALIALADATLHQEKQQSIIQSIASRYDHSSEHADRIKDAFDSDKAPIVGQAMARIGDQELLDFLQEKMLATGGYPNHARDAILLWSEANALPILFDLLGQSDLETAASDRIVRLADQLNTSQRLLSLRKLLSMVADDALRSSAFQALSRTHTVPTVRYLASVLDQEDQQVMAASALVRIGQEAMANQLPLTDSDHQVMARAAKILGDDMNPYAAAELKSLLDAGPSPNGFSTIFNGRDLSGWKGLVGNPISRAKMSLDERKAAQQVADSIMQLSWFVEDGQIKFEGDGYDNLVTDIESYRDFELILDWKIEKDGDSGLYLRGSPQVQIWDPDRENAGVGSGGLFNNQVHPSTPIKRADNPVGEWNTFRVIMINEKVTVFLNGELVADQVTLENYWDREQPIFRRGPIELQAHTTPLAFRDIYLREIDHVQEISSAEIADGFVSLYNGVNLDGWIGNTTDYVSQDGQIVILPTLSGGSGNLYTAKEYDDFTLRFEFKLTPGANNGLGIHTPLEGDAAYLGKELQILDNTADIYANLKEYQYHGSAYGIAPAKRGFQRPVGEWNIQEVQVRGNRIKVILNGEVILDADLDALSENGTMDGRDHPGLKRTSGHIGFLGHGSEVRFRNIRIKEF